MTVNEQPTRKIDCDDVLVVGRRHAIARRPTEDPSDGFDHGGWLVPFADDDMERLVFEWTTTAGGILLGRKTYQLMAAHWPLATDDDDALASTMNTLPKYVASTTLDKEATHEGAPKEKESRS
jgi:dihydrofolate reductase